MDDGRYEAQGRAAALGFTKTGKEQIAIGLEIVDGPHAGSHVTWYGYFTPDTSERTFRAMRVLGWTGDDLSDLAGIDANKVSITLKSEEYDGRVQQKVAWINPLGGVVLKDRMTPEQAKAFAAQMKGAAIASRNGTPSTTPRAKPGRPTREPGDDIDDIF